MMEHDDRAILTHHSPPPPPSVARGPGFLESIAFARSVAATFAVLSIVFGLMVLDRGETIAEREGDVTEAQEQVAALEGDLDTALRDGDEARSNAADAEADADEYRRLADLGDRCSRGVLDALSYSLDGFYGLALDSLNSVRPVCRRVWNASTNGAVTF